MIFIYLLIFYKIPYGLTILSVCNLWENLEEPYTLWERITVISLSCSILDKRLTLIYQFITISLIFPQLRMVM